MDWGRRLKADGTDESRLLAGEKDKYFRKTAGEGARMTLDYLGMK